MIDVIREINATRRTVGSHVLEAGEVTTVTITRTYDAPVDDVWDACTNPERIPRWFLPISGELRVGGRYQLEGNAGGTIETCEPPTTFSATWEFGGNLTWIELTLTPEGDDRTRFELRHTVGHDSQFDEFGPGAVGVGWDCGLLGLGMHLATGETVDPAPVMAWLASDDGLRFATLSSQAWGDANIEGGADPADAQAKVDRTTAAYTGA